MKPLVTLILVCGLSASIYAGEPVYLKRSVETIVPVKTELSTGTADYLPIFGEGDKGSAIVDGVKRFGILKLASGGASNRVSYAREELSCYVLSGTGLIRYGDETLPISTDDFFYIPIGTEFGFSNPRERSLEVAVMGYEIPEGIEVAPTPEVMLASAHEVPFLILGQHGPTTQFQLLMGTTESKRDRLAAAYQINSLFVIDFAVGGTNIPHRHEQAEEVYYVLRGSGEMVAGETEDGGELRYPATQGDAFFFSRNTLVGFYSGTAEGEEHARILAVRSKYPD